MNQLLNLTTIYKLTPKRNIPTLDLLVVQSLLANLRFMKDIIHKKHLLSIGVLGLLLLFFFNFSFACHTRLTNLLALSPCP